MKLTELFPELEIITLNGKEYEVKYTTWSMVQLERDYPDQIINNKETSSPERIMKALNSGFTQMKTTDLIDLLYAGICHEYEEKKPPIMTKEQLINAMQPCFFPTYIDHILTAYQLSKNTPEQLEKMEVMVATNGSKKKTENEILQENMPTIEQSADYQNRSILTLLKGN